MAILVIAEHDNSSIKAATLNAVTAATKMGGDIHLLVAGSNCADAAAAAARISRGEQGAGCRRAALRRSVAREPGGAGGRHAAGYRICWRPRRPAARTSCRASPRCSTWRRSRRSRRRIADTFVRPIYAGNVIATVQSADPVKVITVRATAFEAAGEGGSAAIETVSLPAPISVCRAN
jgi:electron transfer flavoprotein alpha subunit